VKSGTWVQSSMFSIIRLFSSSRWRRRWIWWSWFAGGGGGAGGFRTSGFPGGTAVTASYYAGSSIPVTVGAGGAGSCP
jgi:hypothetical protein